MKKNVASIRGELCVLQSVFSSMDLPSVMIADKSASGQMQEAPICSVEVGLLFSMQNMFLILLSHLSLLSMLSLQTILQLVIKKACPITYLCCLDQPSYLSATSILQLLPDCLQNPLSRHFLALLVSFLLCDFDVIIQLNGNIPQKTGYVPPVTFFTCIFRHLI